MRIFDLRIKKPEWEHSIYASERWKSRLTEMGLSAMETDLANKGWDLGSQGPQGMCELMRTLHIFYFCIFSMSILLFEDYLVRHSSAVVKETWLKIVVPPTAYLLVFQ